MLEFCDRSRSDELNGVEWIEPAIDLNAPAGRLCRSADGQERFSFAFLAGVLPEAMVAAIADAQTRGEPLTLDGIHYLFARLERMLVSRRFWWSPVGPEPSLLEFLAAAYGVPEELHLRDPDRLSRLAAWLEQWQPGRGQIDRAIQLYEAVTGQNLPEGWLHWNQTGLKRLPPAGQPVAPPAGASRAPVPDLQNEILVCHGEIWWEARGADTFIPAYRIEGGMVCFQPPQTTDSARAELLPLSAEDVAVALRPGAAPAAVMMRLIPAWMSVRPCNPVSSPVSSKDPVSSKESR